MTELTPKPYTIKLFMPDGNPDAFKIINKMNWTGIGLEVSPEVWERHKNRKEFLEAGVYVLIGYTEDSERQNAKWESLASYAGVKACHLYYKLKKHEDKYPNYYTSFSSNIFYNHFGTKIWS